MFIKLRGCSGQHVRLCPKKQTSVSGTKLTVFRICYLLPHKFNRFNDPWFCLWPLGSSSRTHYEQKKTVAYGALTHNLSFRSHTLHYMAVSGCANALWLRTGELQPHRGLGPQLFSSLKLAFHVTSATCMCGRRSQPLPHDATEAGLRGLRS